MEIKLVDIDSHGIPNLALMKISAYHKRKGDIVGFNVVNPDKVYISCIFKWNKQRTMQTVKGYEIFTKAEIEVGGLGINDDVLNEEIEHLCPDYTLYNLDYSIGFTSRGCIRRCPFCDVWKREGKIRHHSDLNEFLRHDKVILLDNNLLADPNVEKTLVQLRDDKIKVNFTQGLDLRLMTKNYAKILSKIKYTTRKFNKPTIYVAWDRMKDESEILSGLETMVNNGIKPYRIMCYMLTGYDTTFEEDMYRFEKLREFKVNPFVMLYNKQGDKRQREFARWINKRFYKWKPFYSFEKFLNNNYSKSKEKNIVTQSTNIPIFRY